MSDTEHRRAEMVRRQVERRGVRDPRVLEAMRRVPRERFLPEGMRSSAYDDRALPIACHQTISQPYIVGMMLEALAPTPGERVLEVGTGSGYVAALLAELAAEVFGIERHPLLVSDARARLAELGYRNVRIREGDGTLGWPEMAPFDAILVSAAAPAPPPALEAQLAPGGRLVLPVGPSRWEQELVRLTRRGTGGLTRDRLGWVRFVPLVGSGGWADEPDFRDLDPELRP